MLRPAPRALANKTGTVAIKGVHPLLEPCSRPSTVVTGTKRHVARRRTQVILSFRRRWSARATRQDRGLPGLNKKIEA